MPTPTQPLLTEKEAAKILSMSPKTLSLWRYQGTGPTFIKLGSSIRYQLNDLEAWVEQHRMVKSA